MKKEKLVRFVTAALLLSLILLFGFTSLGMWNFGVVYISLLCLPVIIGTLSLGLSWGLLLALGFGTVSFITNIRAPSALVTPILASNVLWLILLCYIPRMLVPVAAHAVYKLFCRDRSKVKYLFIPSAAGSLTNTFLFLGSILLMYTLIGVDDPAILTTLGTIVLAGGLPEAAACAIIVPPVVMALRKAKLIKI